MRLIARQRINGIYSDEGLFALDGIKFFEADVKTVDELIDAFERAYPRFINCYYTILE